MGNGRLKGEHGGSGDEGHSLVRAASDRHWKEQFGVLILGERSGWGQRAIRGLSVLGEGQLTELPSWWRAEPLVPEQSECLF